MYDKIHYKLKKKKKEKKIKKKKINYCLIFLHIEFCGMLVKTESFADLILKMCR